MTLRIELPADQEPTTFLWGEIVPKIGPAAARFSAAVYTHSTLSLREFEAARLRIAQINHCLFCLDWRTERDGERVDEAFYDEVEHWREHLAGDATTSPLSPRELLAAEYAERFAVDHLSLDDDEAFWVRMKAAYRDAEIVELSMSIGSWIAFGRVNHVLGIDAECRLPADIGH
jgi:alkylhydroperoxidase family enzyme